MPLSPHVAEHCSHSPTNHLTGIVFNPFLWLKKVLGLAIHCFAFLLKLWFRCVLLLTNGILHPTLAGHVRAIQCSGANPFAATDRTARPFARLPQEFDVLLQRHREFVFDRTVFGCRPLQQKGDCDWLFQGAIGCQLSAMPYKCEWCHSSPFVTHSVPPSPFSYRNAVPPAMMFLSSTWIW